MAYKEFTPQAAFGDSSVFDASTHLSKKDGVDKEDIKWAVDTWKNNGYSELLGRQVKFNDLISTPNSSIWMPVVISEAIREPVEPMAIIPSLLDRVQYDQAAKITFPAIGALEAYEIAPGQTYREQSLQVAPGSITMNVGKYGLAFAFTEEMIKYSQFDIMNLHLRAGRRAMDRLKEKRGWDYITAMGIPLFDNINPDTSMFGTCTGRAIDGSGNGSCRMEDLVKAYTYSLMNGFIPNTLIMHPMTWNIWHTDPLLQAITKNTGNGSWFQPSNPARSALPWKSASLGGLGIPSGYGQYIPAGNAAGQTPTSVSGLDQNLNSTANVPGYFPWPLTVLVSPFMKFENNLADIILCDRGSLGALVVEEDIFIDEWEDKSADTMKVKMREKYCFHMYEDGLAINVLKNIPVKANEIAFPLQATISAAGSLAELDTSTAITF